MEVIIMQLLILFIAYVTLFYSAHKIFFWFNNRKKTYDIHKIVEINLLEHKYKIDVKKIGTNRMLNIVSLSNAVIYTVMLMATRPIDNIIIRLVVMFLLIIPVIYLVYSIIGNWLRKKGKDKDV